MMPCPECRNENYKEARQCPKHNGKPVCIWCCRKCIYYDPDPLGIKCGWNIKHRTETPKEEIEKIEKQIIHAEAKVRRLYKLNWPRKAEVLELEVRRLMAEKRRIEERYDKDAKNQP